MNFPNRFLTRQILIKHLMCWVSVLNLAVFVFSSDTFYNVGLFSFSARLLLVFNIVILLCVVTLRMLDRRVFHTLCLLAIIIVTAYMSFSIHPYGSTNDFITLLAGYLAVPIYMLVVPEIEYSEDMRSWFKVVCLLYALFFIYCGFLTPTYREGTNALMLGYSNSNRTGAYMLLTVVLMIVLFAREVKIWIRVCTWIIEICLMYLMVLTQCRTAFLIALACLIYSVLPKTPEIGKKFSIFCVIFPAVFLVLYVLAYTQGWLSDVTILGRTIYSGRQETFVSDSQSLSVFGNYAAGRFVGLNYVQAVLNTWGIVGLGLCWLYYIRFFISDFLDDCDYMFSNNLSRFCFSVLMLHGCTEASFFTGGTVYAGMLGCILFVISMNKGGI